MSQTTAMAISLIPAVSGDNFRSSVNTRVSLENVTQSVIKKEKKTTTTLEQGCDNLTSEASQAHVTSVLCNWNFITRESVSRSRRLLSEFTDSVVLFGYHCVTPDTPFIRQSKCCTENSRPSGPCLLARNPSNRRFFRPEAKFYHRYTSENVNFND